MAVRLSSFDGISTLGTSTLQVRSPERKEEQRFGRQHTTPRHELRISFSKPDFLQELQQTLGPLQLLVVNLRRHRLQFEAVRRVRVHHCRQHVEREARLHGHGDLVDHLPGARSQNVRPQYFEVLLLVCDLDDAAEVVVAYGPVHVLDFSNRHLHRVIPELDLRLLLRHTHGRRLRIREGGAGNVLQHPRIRQGKQRVSGRYGALIAGVVRELPIPGAIPRGVHTPAGRSEFGIDLDAPVGE
mmetsp:Transcript_33830/g.69056  ORF Transcript_33830/g.69056 Transcript_33830/m.69056 type:complete len:242 (-) Transcript_33830:658-1383(-)